MAFGTKLNKIVSWVLGADGWKPPMEDFLRTMDTLVQLNALGWSTHPNPNDPYSLTGTWIVGDEYNPSEPQALGAFADRSRGDIATWQPDLNSWYFITPKEGWQATINQECKYFRFGIWEAVVPFQAPPADLSCHMGFYSDLGGVDNKVYGLSYYAAGIFKYANPEYPRLCTATFEFANPEGAMLGLAEQSSQITAFIPQFDLVDRLGQPIAANTIAAGETRVLLMGYQPGAAIVI